VRSFGLLSLEKIRLKGDLIAVYRFLKGGQWSRAAYLLHLVTSDSARENGMKFRGSSDWTVGKGSSLREWSVTGTGSPGKQSWQQVVRVQEVSGQHS